MDISITRRRAMLAPLIGGFAALTLNGYTFAYAPIMRLDVTLRCRPRALAVRTRTTNCRLTDLHFGEPFVSLGALRRSSQRPMRCIRTLFAFWGISSRVTLLSHAKYRAPIGHLPCHVESPSRRTHGAWQSRLVVGCGGESRRTSVPLAARALMDAGLPVLENEAVPLFKDGKQFWIIGLGDQLAYHRKSRGYFGRDNLAGALVAVTDGAPILLLAHEPDILPWFRRGSP